MVLFSFGKETTRRTSKCDKGLYKCQAVGQIQPSEGKCRARNPQFWSPFLSQWKRMKEGDGTKQNIRTSFPLFHMQMFIRVIDEPMHKKLQGGRNQGSRNQSNETSHPASCQIVVLTYSPKYFPVSLEVLLQGLIQGRENKSF